VKFEITDPEHLKPSNNGLNDRCNGLPKDTDYTVISRLFDSETGHWILSLGGLRKQGTRAARDLLIDSSYASLLPSQIRSTGNFQIVLKTSILNGSAGPPQILAVYTW
jgi:hypothetical protein